VIVMRRWCGELAAKSNPEERIYLYQVLVVFGLSGRQGRRDCNAGGQSRPATFAKSPVGRGWECGAALWTTTVQDGDVHSRRMIGNRGNGAELWQL
jgi:hypothetical protein